MPEPADARRIAAPAGDVEFEHVAFSYKPDEPLIEDMNIDGRAGPDHRHRRADRRGQDHAGQPADALLRARWRPDHRRRRRHHASCGAATCAACSAWCCRIPGSSTARSARTSPTAARTPPRKRSCRRPKPRHADHFIRTLPDGYDTVLNEEASNISQGQKQLLTIARAVLADPRDPDPRRGDQQRGHAHRGADPAGDGDADDRAHQLRDRPPALDDPRRRPDPGDEPRHASSSRARTRNCWRRTASTPTCTTASSPRALPSKRP